jgi:hypothetical protein
MPSRGFLRPFCGQFDDVAEFSGKRKPLTRRPDQIEAHDVRLFCAGAQHLCTLGSRPTAEFLAELGRVYGISGEILERLNRWRDRLTPELVRAVGGDRFPPPLAVLRGGRR